MTGTLTVTLWHAVAVLAWWMVAWFAIGWLLRGDADAEERGEPL
jgi:hypothetical protein